MNERMDHIAQCVGYWVPWLSPAALTLSSSSGPLAVFLGVVMFWSSVSKSLLAVCVVTEFAVIFVGKSQKGGGQRDGS